MSSNGNRPLRARLLDFSDREILAIVDDLADAEGWVTTRRLSETIFPTGGDSAHAHRCTAIRMAWMRRYGVCEKGDKDEETTWRLTVEGHAFVRGKLTTAQAKMLEALPEEGLLPLMTTVGKRYRVASSVGATLVRREWTHGSALRR